MIGELLPVAVAAPAIAGCLLLLLGDRLARLVDAVSVTVCALETALLAVILAIGHSGAPVHFLAGWQANAGRGVGIVLVGDAAGVELATLAALLATAALLYGWRYFERQHSRYNALVLLFVAAMVGYSLSGDLFDMFVFFELMGAIAYSLTGFKVEDPQSVQGSFNFAVVNSVGAYVTLFGIGMLYARTGRLGLAQLGGALDGRQPDMLLRMSFVLVCVGWLVKAAVVPFHFWLADAHAVAPTPVCVLFSGIMAPLGVYGVLRTYWTVFAGTLEHGMVSRVLLVFGVITALLGAVMCVLQRHIKRLLAYSTIAHIGLVVTGVSGLDGTGAAAAWDYLIAHAGVKGALFLLAGMLLARFRDVDEIGLYGKGGRLLGVPFILGGLALAGLPPFGIALGKAAFEEQVPVWQTVVIVLASSLTAGAVLRAGLRVFYGLGPAPRDSAESERTSGEDESPEGGVELPRFPATMVATVGALIVLGLAMGTVPGLIGAAASAGSALVDHSGYEAAVLGGAPGGPAAALGWSWSGALLGVLSAALAVGFGLVSLRAGVPAALGRAVSALHRVHSGHVGDYVMWLVCGAALFAVLAAW